MKQAIPSSDLPVIPQKRYFSISEAADLCAVKTHVLRYWEQEFTVLKPTKRAGSRRYYTVENIELIRHIRDLLYCKGFTINGARTHLKSQKLKTPEPMSPSAKKVIDEKAQHFVKGMVTELQDLLQDLK
mgnify:CR=1 FL=1|jgi:DNA-binding transcriptional MerR regulator